jgi:predicted RNase H-related nuclease YkuK (DUF458 family)
MKTFRSLTNRKEVDLIPYVSNFLKENEGTILYVGCDSQNVREWTNYATVIVLYNPGKGGHVLYSKTVMPKIEDRYTKLWNEVEYSIEVAEYLTNNGIQRPSYIDLDLNPDPKYKSNQILRAALGYVESMGYIPRCKPNAMVASHVADALCK